MTAERNSIAGLSSHVAARLQGLPTKSTERTTTGRLRPGQTQKLCYLKEPICLVQYRDTVETV